MASGKVESSWKVSQACCKVSQKDFVLLLRDMWHHVRHWMVLAAPTRMDGWNEIRVFGPRSSTQSALKEPRVLQPPTHNCALPSFCLSLCSHPLLDPFGTPTCKNISSGANDLTYGFLSFPHNDDDGLLKKTKKKGQFHNWFQKTSSVFSLLSENRSNLLRLALMTILLATCSSLGVPPFDSRHLRLHMIKTPNFLGSQLTRMENK